jgi:hypothetical protein
MGLFNKLPGFVKTPPGDEWILFKKIPKIFLSGISILLACIAYLHFFSDLPPTVAQRYIYLCLGLLFTHCFFVGVAFIGCIVVMIMKGPAYVADPYALPVENKKLEESD